MNKSTYVLSVFFLMIFLVSFVSALDNCYDSDVTSKFLNGINPYQKGMIEYNLNKGIGYKGLAQDSCSSNGMQVKEYYCAEYLGEENYYAVHEYIDCENGCGNGVCLLGDAGDHCSENIECGSNLCIKHECVNRNILQLLMEFLFDKFGHKLGGII